MGPSLAFFPAPTADGEALCPLVQAVAEEHGLVFHLPERSRDAYASACFNDDVVVVDATPGRPGEHNYHEAMPLPFNHVLVVSRRRLPLNVTGLRTQIADTDGRPHYGAPITPVRRLDGTFGPARLTNDELATWLDLQLAALRTMGRIPRPREGVIKQFRGLRPAIEAEEEDRGRTGQIFISFRAQRGPQGERATLERLERLGAELRASADPVATVRFFPPGAISGELMPAMRYWNVAATIDRYIAPATRMVVDLRHGYRNSWWTQLELLTLVYRRYADGRDDLPRLEAVTDDSLALGPLPDGLLPTMDDTQRRRMARWYSNADPGEMSIEGTVAQRLIPDRGSRIPLAGPWLKRRLERSEWFSDPVWTDAWWLDPILDCSRCRALDPLAGADLVDHLLYHKGPWITRLTVAEAEAAADTGEVRCRSCRARYRIQRSEDPNLVFGPIINGNPTGRLFAESFGLDTDDPNLVTLPTFQILDEITDEAAGG